MICCEDASLITTNDISEFKSLFSSMNLKHRATSIKGTKLLICLPPAYSFKVPFWDEIFENKLGIISRRIVSEE